MTRVYLPPNPTASAVVRNRVLRGDHEAEIVGARKNHGDVRHVIEDLEGELPDKGATVAGEIDEERRETLRRMHTAQHVVSRVVLEEFGAATVGNQIHEDRSRIDFEPASFDDEDLALIERETNAVIETDRAVTKENRPRAEVEENVPEGRTQLDLIPDHVDALRVVAIDDFDMCPCGGTHVDSVGAVGGIDIVERTSKGASVDRIEFELRDPETAG